MFPKGMATRDKVKKKKQDKVDMLRVPVKPTSNSITGENNNVREASDLARSPCRIARSFHLVQYYKISRTSPCTRSEWLATERVTEKERSKKFLNLNLYLN